MLQQRRLHAQPSPRNVCNNTGWGMNYCVRKSNRVGSRFWQWLRAKFWRQHWSPHSRHESMHELRAVCHPLKVLKPIHTFNYLFIQSDFYQLLPVLVIVCTSHIVRLCPAYPHSSALQCPLHSSSSRSTSPLVSPHRTTSSAYIMLRTPRLTPLVNTSKTILNKKGLCAEPWCRPTFTSKPSVVPTPLLTLVFTSLYISFISRTYFSGTIFSLKHLHSSSLGTLSYAFSRSMNTICKSLPFSLYFSAICLRINIAFVVSRPSMNPNCSSATSTSPLTLLSTIRSQIFIVWERSFIPR